MNDQDKQNHWQSLASELGAEPQEETETGSQETKQPEQQDDIPVEAQRITATTKMPGQPAANWEDLALALGADVPPPRETAEPPPPEPPVQPAAEDFPEPAAESPPQEFTLEEETADMAEEILSESAAETVSARPRRVPHGRPSDDGEEARPENFAESMDHIETAVEFAPEDGSAAEPGAADQPGETPGAVTQQPSEDEQEPRRRRRRRRGRRGASTRGGAPADEAEVEEATAAEAEPLEDDGLDAEALIDDEDEDELEEQDRKTSPGRRAAHRNIPTWEEAIGLVISANLDARQRAGKSGSGGRARGRGRRGRGRSSGGRKSEPRK